MKKYSDKFINIFAEKVGDSYVCKDKYRLPRRWDGVDFCKTIYWFFKEYKKDVQAEFPELEQKIKYITLYLYASLVKSYQGLSLESYDCFNKAMSYLKKKPLWFDDDKLNHLKLYRVVDAGSTELPCRTRIFHVPFTMRSKMATQRFSIPGFPGLYLGTSIELCCNEIGKDISCPTVIASGFEFCPSHNYDSFEGRYLSKIYNISISPNRIFNQSNKSTPKYAIDDFDETAYLLWYPLIAACSFIRAKKGDPYAPEYIFSQHFMQWIRVNAYNSIPGVKYFSCSSERAAEMGDNFAFPTTGVPYRMLDTIQEYDLLLARNFKLTNPCFLNEFLTYAECEEKLSHDEKAFIEKAPTNPVIGAYEIPDGEIEVGYCSFNGCRELTKIIIPDSIISIGDRAFEGCTALTEITIPDSVTSIGNSAFAHCKSLTKFNIPNSVTSIGSFTFEGCTGLTEIVIPDGVTSINHGTFWFCKGLTEIGIPNGVTFIGVQAFEGCESLIKIIIPYGVTSIGESAFSCCTALTEINISSNVSFIGIGAFDRSPNCKIKMDENNKKYYCRDNCIYERSTNKMITNPANYD